MIKTRFSLLRFLRRAMIFRFAFNRAWGFCFKRSWVIENNLSKYISRSGSEEHFLSKMSDHLRILYI